MFWATAVLTVLVFVQDCYKVFNGGGVNEGQGCGPSVKGGMSLGGE